MANLAAVRTDMHRGTYVDPMAGDIIFRRYAEHWLETAAEQEPLTRLRNGDRLKLHIYPALGELPLSAIKPTHIQAWLRDLSEKPGRNSPPARRGDPDAVTRVLSGATWERIFATAFSVFEAAVADERIPNNSMRAKSVRKPKKDTAKAQPWTPERAQAVYAELPERWRIILPLGLSAGLRRGEMMALDPYTDIDWDAKTITVQRQVLQLPKSKMAFSLPKYRKVRVVSVSDELLTAIKEHMAAYPPREVTLPWRELTGEPLTRHLLLTSREGGAGHAVHVSSNVWRPACRRAGFEPTNRDGLHVLRHTYASLLIHEGESIVTVAARLGHGDASITLATYSHMMPNSEDRTRDITGGFLAGTLGRTSGTTTN